VSGTLYRQTKPGLSLSEALEALPERPAVALLMAPGWCRFGLVGGADPLQPKGPEGKDIDLAGVYDARVFNEHAELRWRKDPLSSRHRSAVISEEPLALNGWESDDINNFSDTILQEYLLWGQRAEEASSGWTRLTTARIGSLWVPAIGGLRFKIRACEYLREFEDGNVAVAEERLLALESFAGEGANHE
jgi:CRISPR-associated protein (TIGR03984 family)